MFVWQKEIRDSMLLLISKNREYIETNQNILNYVHELYMSQKAHLYSEDEIRWISYFLDSVTYKWFLVSIALEQLQSIRYGRINKSIWPAIENSIDRLDCSDDERVLVSFALESFLFEARSFLDIYMIFVCLLLRTGFSKGYMGKSRFYDELEKTTEAPFAQKAQWVKTYFDTKVFGQEENEGAAVYRDDWGTLLASLRNKIAHRDTLNLAFDSKEKLINDILLDWPTLKGITYHSLAETIRNGMRALFDEVLCHIYELKWDDYQKIAQPNFNAH